MKWDLTQDVLPHSFSYALEKFFHAYMSFYFSFQIKAEGITSGFILTTFFFYMKIYILFFLMTVLKLAFISQATYTSLLVKNENIIEKAEIFLYQLVCAHTLTFLPSLYSHWNHIGWYIGLFYPFIYLHIYPWKIYSKVH